MAVYIDWRAGGKGRCSSEVERGAELSETSVLTFFQHGIHLA